MDPTLYPGLGRGRLAITGALTLGASHVGLVIDATSGTFTVSAAAAATLGAHFQVALYNSGSGVVTFDPDGSETVRLPTGTATSVTLTQGQGLYLSCDGSNWRAILSVGYPAAPATSLTVYDNAFTIQDNTDPTKQAQFQLSGITTGTTRTYTLPDTTTTIAGLSVAQTWTATQAFAAITATTGVFSSTLTASSLYAEGTTGGAFSHISANAATQRMFVLRTGTSNRWLIGANASSESGSDAGSDFQMLARTDSGTAIDAPLSIVRAAGGAITTPRPFSQTGATTFSTGTGNVSLNGAVTAASTLAVTGTSTFTGRIGVGTAPTTNSAIRISTPSDLAGTDQSAFNFAAFVVTSAATSSGRGVTVNVSTAAASFTCAQVSGVHVNAVAAGAGSTITRAAGFSTAAQTAGSTGNFGFYYGGSSLTSGSGTWAFYNATTDPVRMSSGGDVVVGSAALAATATSGFLYVPTCAGTPTGTPSGQTGMAPIVVDSTNNKLYFYSGGAWRDAGP